eukprot:1141032-Pelagomonas_calceolata.AAC.2
MSCKGFALADDMSCQTFPGCWQQCAQVLLRMSYPTTPHELPNNTSPNPRLVSPSTKHCISTGAQLPATGQVTMLRTVLQVGNWKRN